MKFAALKLGLNLNFRPRLLKTYHCKAAERVPLTSYIFNQWWQYGKAFLRTVFIRKGVKSTDGIKNCQVFIPNVIAKPTAENVPHWKNVFSRVVTKCASDSWAAELRRNTAKKLMFGTGNTFALLGFALAKEPSLLTQKEELEVICQEIREAFQNQPSKENGFKFESKISLEHLNLGSMLAKGCNAAVLSASWKPDIFYEEINGNTETLSGGSFGPLAVKMMFNFTAESNAPAISRAMYRESVPAQMGSFLENTGSANRFRLPVHVNIVEIFCAFADFVPNIPEGPEDFPDALPARLLETGLGRNMTYFLVMRRYDCTLREYLRSNNPNSRTSLLLFSQLLEGLVHLHNHRVAHRDLKSDNILLSLAYGTECPHLVITDFGCCLAERSFEVAYPNEDVFRGGNMALMAPEVITAVPGRNSVIDYQKADVWAAGTIAYEIFGGKNPFYEGTPFHLENHSYQDKDLAPLPPHTSSPVQKVVKAMLTRDPQKRLNAHDAADLCQLMVHAPVGLPLRQQEVLLWLVALAGLTFYHQGEPEDAVEQQLRSLFLARISLQSTLSALHFLQL